MRSRMRERYHAEAAICQFPNDVWQAMVLEDFQRIALPTFQLPAAACAHGG
jgi:hypothetical protein